MFNRNKIKTLQRKITELQERNSKLNLEIAFKNDKINNYQNQWILNDAEHKKFKENFKILEKQFAIIENDNKALITNRNYLATKLKEREAELIKLHWQVDHPAKYKKGETYGNILILDVVIKENTEKPKPEYIPKAERAGIGFIIDMFHMVREVVNQLREPYIYLYKITYEHSNIIHTVSAKYIDGTAKEFNNLTSKKKKNENDKK